MASWFVEAAVAEPLARPRGRTKPKAKARTRTRGRARSGILWIVASGVLLAGVVFVNVAVLRLNLQLDQATKQRTNLHSQNAVLQSKLSSQLASPRIQSIARHQDGLVDADPATIGYINLGH